MKIIYQDGPSCFVTVSISCLWFRRRFIHECRRAYLTSSCATTPFTLLQLIILHAIPLAPKPSVRLIYIYAQFPHSARL